jgi:steroid 5-alpha reductase family enzyme
MISIVLTNLLTIVSLMFVLWIVGTMRRDVSLVDPFWGAGFTILAWTSVVQSRSFGPQALLIALLTSLWGLRLSLYLSWRNWGHAEDSRYAAMRTHHQQRFWYVSLATVFLLQAVIMWIVAMPIQAAILNRTNVSNNRLNIAGIALWAVGVFFETAGDLQLARFKSNPENAHRVMNQGLWSYTRHPNYFGDFCVWWGLYLVCASAGAWWTVFSPVLMSVLLLKVSGVTLLEKTITSRRPDYAEYQRRTSAFFPWKPSR